MSLIYWLPLTKNIINRGCSLDLFSSNSELDFSHAGKIGYSFTSNTPIGTNGSVTFSTTISISCWIQIDSLISNTTGWLIHLGSSNGAARGIWLDCTNKQIKWAYGGNEDILTLPNDSTFFTDRKWHHLAVASDDIKATLYIDGNKIDTYTLINNNTPISGTSVTIGNENFLETYLNDVRIYNHCLSAVEVSEISKGLILHWKLNNLNFIGSDCSGYNNEGITDGTLSNFTTSVPRYSQAISFNGTYLATPKGLFKWYNLSEGTISAWVRPHANSGNIGLVMIPESNSYSQLNTSVTTEEGETMSKIKMTNNNLIPNSLNFSVTSNKLSLSNKTTGNTKTLFINDEKKLAIKRAVNDSYKTISLINHNNTIKIMYSDGTNLQLYSLANSPVITVDKWYFLALTFQNGNIFLYLNGEKVNNTIALLTDWSNAQTNSGNLQFQIGLDIYNESYFNGAYSDVRLYTTPLLDKDIKMLYNTNMRIDNLGRVHNFEFEEVLSGSKLKSNGILQTVSLEENSGNAARLKQDYKWYSSNFVEY